jgi:hypothetical protein
MVDSEDENVEIGTVADEFEHLDFLEDDEQTEFESGGAHNQPQKPEENEEAKQSDFAMV